MKRPEKRALLQGYRNRGIYPPLAIMLSAYKPREDNRETRSGADRH